MALEDSVILLLIGHHATVDQRGVVQVVGIGPAYHGEGAANGLLGGQAVQHIHDAAEVRMASRGGLPSPRRFRWRRAPGMRIGCHLCAKTVCGPRGICATSYQFRSDWVAH